MHCERGQATIEWVGLVCLAAVGFGALALAVPGVDGRSFGGFLTHRIVCAVRGAACADAALRRVYGPGDAELVRRFAPRGGLRAGRAPAAGRLPPLPLAGVRARSGRSRSRRPPHRRRGAGHAVHPRGALAGADLHPVLVLLPGLELGRAGLGPAVAARVRGCALPGLPSRRLGGPPGPDRPRRHHRRALDLARPPPVVQAARVPEPVGRVDRLDPGLARQPRRPHPAGAHGLRGPAHALPAARSRAGTCASAPPRPRGSSWCRWSGSTSAATGGWERGCHRPGASVRTTGPRIRTPDAQPAGIGDSPPVGRIESIDTTQGSGKVVARDGADRPRAAGQAA